MRYSCQGEVKSMNPESAVILENNATMAGIVECVGVFLSKRIIKIGTAMCNLQACTTRLEDLHCMPSHVRACTTRLEDLHCMPSHVRACTIRLEDLHCMPSVQPTVITPRVNYSMSSER